MSKQNAHLNTMAKTSVNMANTYVKFKMIGQKL